MACQTCRLRKVKCDRVRPRCKNCIQRSFNCIYQGERIKRRRLNDVEERLVETPEMLSFLRPRNPADVAIIVADDLSFGARHIDLEKNPNQQADSYLSPASTNSYILLERSNGDPNRRDSNCPGSVSPENFSGSISHPENLLDQILARDPQPAPTHRHPSVWIRTEVGDEYTGPSSGISAISEQGLNWIRDKVRGCGCLCNIFKQLRSTLLNHLRQPKGMGPGLWLNFPVHAPQMDLPPWDTIQDYVEAYFSDVQVIFPVLDKETFETQLMEFKSGQTQASPSWKALLFAVLASGCRAALSDETAQAFQKSASEAWPYFVSALSYEQMMVHVATDLTAVQALTVMTVFAQGMSSPQRLEYTLCSTAVRLAFSLAMNRAAPAEWGLTKFEENERNRTFWAIYCLDKTLALRCGRPSIIDDAEISCAFPRGTTSTSGTPSSGSADGRQEFDVFLCFTQFARICGRIVRHLYSAFALSQYCTQLTEQATQLLMDLHTWRSSIPTTKNTRQLLNCNQTTTRVSKTQLLVLQLSYYYGLCAVYRRFSSIFCHSDENESEVQKLLRGVTITSQVEAARSMVLLTKHLDVESYSPGWLLFYYPMTALITIFVHVICNPSDTSANHDIALMEVAVGFFGRLEYVTSGEAGFTQTTEFVRHARFVVDKSPENPCQCEPEGLGPAVSSACFRGADEAGTEMAHNHTETTGNLRDVEHQPNGLQVCSGSESDRNLDVSIDHNGGTETLDSRASRMLHSRPGSTCDLSESHTDTASADVVLPQLGTSPYDSWLSNWMSPPAIDVSNVSSFY